MSPVLRIWTHIYGAYKEIDGKTCIFRVHLGTPQINHLGKLSPVYKVSTHIFGLSKEIDGKTFIFRVNLGMWPLKSIVLEKWALFSGFEHIFMGVSKEIDGKICILRVHLGTPQINHLGKLSPVYKVSTHIFGLSKEIDGKTFIFTVNLGMWPLKSIVFEKWALFSGFEHTFMGFPWRLMGKHSFLSKPRHVTPEIDHLGKMKWTLFWGFQHSFMQFPRR